MINYILALLLGLISTTTSIANGPFSPSNGSGPNDIAGEATNDMEPHLIIEKEADDWNVEIDYVSKTHFEKFSWLKPSQRVGSKLQLWLSNGIEVVSTNAGVLSAMHLPSQVMVADIMKAVHPSSRRGTLWLQIEPGMPFPSTAFELKSDLGICFTNDAILQIKPLLYKTDTNEVTAHLVEFPSIKVRLMVNGEVRKEE